MPRATGISFSIVPPPRMSRRSLRASRATEEASKKVRCHISRKLLPFKGFYFFFLAGLGSLLPLICVYFKSVGLNSGEIGVIYGTMPLVIFLLGPSFGALADRLNIHKVILVIGSFLSGAVLLFMLLIPARIHPSLLMRFSLKCTEQNSFFQDCTSVSASDKKQCKACLRNFAQVIKRKRSEGYNASSLDCVSECSNSDQLQVCFTEKHADFAVDCKANKEGTEVVSKGTLVFKLNNLNSLIDSEISVASGGSENCMQFNNTYVEYDQKQYQEIVCEKEATLLCKTSCKRSPTELCETDVREYDATFGYLFLIFLLSNFAMSPVFALADAATFDYLGAEDHLFGQQRVFGTIGSALGALSASSAVTMMTKEGGKPNYSIAFYICAVCSSLASAAASTMTFTIQHQPAESVLPRLMDMLRRPKIVAFFLVVLFFGVTYGAVDGFLFYYLDTLGGKPVLYGLCLLVNGIFETPMILLSGFFIKSIGATHCLNVAILAMGVRHLGYSFLTNPWAVLAIEPLHGITFGLQYAASATNAAQIAPPGLSATVQALIVGIHFGIGKGMGGLLTGFLFSHVGDRNTFRAYAILAAVTLLVYGGLNIFVFKPDRKCTRFFRPSHSDAFIGVFIAEEDDSLAFTVVKTVGIDKARQMASPSCVDVVLSQGLVLARNSLSLMDPLEDTYFESYSCDDELSSEV